MRFQVLGPLDVVEDGRSLPLGGRQQRMLLAILLVEANRPVPSERLLELLWGSDPPERARATLQTYVSNLRRVLEPARRPRGRSEVLVTRAPGYALVVDDDHLDRAQFERLARSGRELVMTDPHRARELLDEALGLWRGEAYGEFGDESWAEQSRERLTELRLACEEDRFRAVIALDEASVTAELTSFVHAHPRRERARAWLMHALYVAGRQGDALQVYEEGRRWLAEALGLEPSPELRSLQRAILSQTVAEPPVRAAAIGPDVTGLGGGRRNPPFLDRDAELEAADEALSDARRGRATVLVIEGEPGAGKTTLLAKVVARFVAAGSLILEGRGLEEGRSPPWWPWPEVLRETSLRIGEAAQPARGGRARLFTDVVQVLQQRATAARPLLLAVDDAHRCGPDAVELLAFVARSLPASPVVLALTVSSEDAEGDPSASDLVSLGALAWSRRLVLGPLSGEEAIAVGRAIAGRSVDSHLLAAVVATTEGNPLFTVELARLLVSQGGVMPTVPPSLRDAVRRRLARLPAGTREVLGPAAVLGRQFEVGVAAEATGRALVEWSASMEPARALGVIEPGSQPGLLRFSHRVIGDVVASDLGARRLREVHLAVAGALERRFAADPRRWAEIAGHLLEALPQGDPARVATWLGAAARHAAGCLGFLQAEQLLRRRLAVLALVGPAGEGEAVAARRDLAELLAWGCG